MIRVVAFDIGKVLLDFDYGILIRKMAPRSRLDINALDCLLNQSPLLSQYESGSIDNAEFFKAVQKVTGYDGTQDEFAAQFENIFTPIQEVIEMHAQISVSGIPTWTFSNTNPMAVSHISRVYDFWPRFTGHILSHEAGALKPDSKIYQALEDATGCTGEEIAYLDDRPENIAAGNDRDWKTIQFKTPVQAKKAFKMIGLL